MVWDTYLILIYHMSSLPWQYYCLFSRYIKALRRREIQPVCIHTCVRACRLLVLEWHYLDFKLFNNFFSIIFSTTDFWPQITLPGGDGRWRRWQTGPNFNGICSLCRPESRQNVRFHYNPLCRWYATLTLHYWDHKYHPLATPLLVQQWNTFQLETKHWAEKMLESVSLRARHTLHTHTWACTHVAVFWMHGSISILFLSLIIIMYTLEADEDHFARIVFYLQRVC